MVIIEGKTRIILGWSYKRLYYNSIVIDKPAVEDIKTKKGLDPLYRTGGFLVMDYFDLFRINFNYIRTYNKSKVLYTFYPKFALLNIDL